MNTTLKSIKKIVLIGPESTGKSTLAKQLAEHYQTVWIKEYAREYIDKLDRDYEQADLLAIAQGQIDAETKQLTAANRLLICDTDLIVIKIWSDVKYGNCDEWILEQIKNRDYDFYLLCGTDIPWEYDVQREHPDAREALYKRYLTQLEFYNKKYIKLFGNKRVRLEKSIKIINSLL